RWADRRVDHTLIPEHLGDEVGQLERLLGVESRIARGLVPTLEVQIRDVLGAAEALGDVLSRELDVDTAGVRTEGVVHLEEALDLVDDPIEVPRSEEHTSELQS